MSMFTNENNATDHPFGDFAMGFDDFQPPAAFGEASSGLSTNPFAPAAMDVGSKRRASTDMLDVNVAQYMSDDSEGSDSGEASHSEAEISIGKLLFEVSSAINNTDNQTNNNNIDHITRTKSVPTLQELHTIVRQVTGNLLPAPEADNSQVEIPSYRRVVSFVGKDEGFDLFRTNSVPDLPATTFEYSLEFNVDGNTPAERMAGTAELPSPFASAPTTPANGQHHFNGNAPMSDANGAFTSHDDLFNTGSFVMAEPERLQAEERISLDLARLEANKQRAMLQSDAYTAMQQQVRQLREQESRQFSPMRHQSQRSQPMRTERPQLPMHRRKRQRRGPSQLEQIAYMQRAGQGIPTDILQQLQARIAREQQKGVPQDSSFFQHVVDSSIGQHSDESSDSDSSSSSMRSGESSDSSAPARSRDNKRRSSSISSQTEDLPIARVYTREEKLQRILRFRQKKANRTYQKRVIYKCRKSFADARPRVGGRFVKKTPEEREAHARKKRLLKEQKRLAKLAKKAEKARLKALEQARRKAEREAKRRAKKASGKSSSGGNRSHSNAPPRVVQEKSFTEQDKHAKYMIRGSPALPSLDLSTLSAPQFASLEQLDQSQQQQQQQQQQPLSVSLQQAWNNQILDMGLSLA